MNSGDVDLLFLKNILSQYWAHTNRFVNRLTYLLKLVNVSLRTVPDLRQFRQPLDVLKLVLVSKRFVSNSPRPAEACHILSRQSYQVLVEWFNL